MIIVLCILFFIAEVRTLPGILFPWIKVLDCRRKPDKKYTHIEIIQEIKSSGKKLAFCDDLVINYQHFYLYHPGGKFMLEDA
mmetsp:Transcript_33054/g.6000  ORF Transcript_33054/g.6000 Transcript_33054/m.6000 type:complete len:82 (+) Transcript_33054:1769-2014(+)